MIPSMDTSTHPKPSSALRSPTPVSQRLLSLDVFRGLTIAAMILVNNPGTWKDVYAPLRHAEWHGWTPTDLVFPFFLFIVGVSMTLSFKRRKLQGDASRTLFKQVLRRTVILFLLGLFLNGFPYFKLSTLRIPGVLQRIAVCYFFAGIIYLTTRLRGQILATLSLLAGYWILMTTVPVPGYGAGVLQPDGNLAAFIDQAVLQGHLYKATWDPEGILSTLPAIATVLLGILSGHWLMSARTPAQGTMGFLSGGIAGIILGHIMNNRFPINKNLWSPSYTVFTAGMAVVIFGICYWMIDVRGNRAWTTPFVVYGRNAIAAYVLSGLVSKSSVTWKVVSSDGKDVWIKTFVYNHVFAQLAAPLNASVLFAITYVLFWLGVMWIFYWKKIFIKI